jgi:copper(I)-binding protein
MLLSLAFPGKYASAANTISVELAFARATPGRAVTGAAYMTLVNGGTSADKLVGAETPAADKVQFHKETEENGISRMREVHDVQLAPGAKIVFKPGEMHMMLVGLKQPLIEGQTFPLTLQFEKAGKVEVTVPIQKVGAMQHEDMGPMHMHDGGTKK